MLITPNMPRIRRLANEYRFLVFIDGTVDGFVNIDILPYADVLMSSLTKMFSGYANVLARRFVGSHPLYTLYRIFD